MAAHGGDYEGLESGIFQQGYCMGNQRRQFGNTSGTYCHGNCRTGWNIPEESLL
jgi:hypothetical protein